MRVILSLVLIPLLCWGGLASHASANAPLCALAPDIDGPLFDANAAVGAAVYDLTSGTLWRGGQVGPYALHSVIKPPLAWAVLTDALEREEELTATEREALQQMVWWSSNNNVDEMIARIGGQRGLNSYYQRWGVTDLSALSHPYRWGFSRAEPAHLARLYAALAISDAVDRQVRTEGIALLRAVDHSQRWGATVLPASLSGWESLVKTGNFTLPEPPDVEQSDERAPVDEAGNSTEDQRSIVRMNSAAIWLAAPEQGSLPRYVITIMQESELTWPASRQLQNELGALIAEAIGLRESGQSPQLADHCLKQALS